MKRVSIIALLASAIIFFAVNPILSQPAADPRPTHFALEIIARSDLPATYQPVPGLEAAFEGAWFFRFGRVASWRPTAGSLPVRSVRVMSKLGASGVRVIVSVQLGAKLVEDEKYVADYIAREGEKTSIATLKNFGLEPIQITLVRVTPTVPSALTITNKTNSIEVISIEAANSTLPGYVLTLRNTAARDIKAFAFHLNAAGKEVLQGQLQNPEGLSFIPAGDFVKTEPIGPRSGAMTAVGYQPATLQNPDLLISTAVFADNTFEGDEAEAAMIVGRDQGRKAQIERILPLLREAAKTEDRNLIDTLAWLKQKVAGLPDDAPESVSAKMYNDFAKTSRSLVLSSIEAGAHLIKLEVLNEITVFQERLSRSIGQRDFAKWVGAMIDKYEAWQSRLY